MEKQQSDRSLKEKREAYWWKNISLIASLLLVWAVVSFGTAIFLADPLSNVMFFHLPLSFWIAQQGAMIVFVLLIFIYSWRMDVLDQRYDVQEVIVAEEHEEAIEKAKEQVDTIGGPSDGEDDTHLNNSDRPETNSDETGRETQ